MNIKVGSSCEFQTNIIKMFYQDLFSVDVPWLRSVHLLCRNGGGGGGEFLYRQQNLLGKYLWVMKSFQYF